MQKLGSPVAVSITVDMPFNKQLYYSNKGAFTNYVDNILPIIDHLSYLATYPLLKFMTEFLYCYRRNSSYRHFITLVVF